MTVVAGLGYTLLSIGPAVALFSSVIATKPFLILTVVASALVWLLTLICVSALCRAFVPSTSDGRLYAVVLISAVLLQEAVRPLLWQVYLRAETTLDALAVKLSKPGLLFTDKIQIALAAGLGHGLAHVFFFCLSLVVVAYGPATYYKESCPEMPFFLATALTGLGFLLIHIASMVIAFMGYSDGKQLLRLFPPCMHLLAALLTLVSAAPHGCTAGVSLVLTCAVASLLFCGKAVWDKTGETVRPHSGTSMPASVL